MLNIEKLFMFLKNLDNDDQNMVILYKHCMDWDTNKQSSLVQRECGCIKETSLDQMHAGPTYQPHLKKEELNNFYRNYFILFLKHTSF